MREGAEGRGASPLARRARVRAARLAIVASALASLLAGVWGGLLRLQWGLPVVLESGPGITHHGHLMVSGFLGTLIGLERAVALGERWAYAGPLLSAVAALGQILGFAEVPSGPLYLAASVLLAAVSVRLARRRLAIHSAATALGAACWCAGNLLAVCEWPRERYVLAWAAFFVLTISAERVEMSRFQRLSRAAHWTYAGTAVMVLAALALAVALEAREHGERLAGAAFTGLALWLLRHDIARRTLREHGLARYAALAVLCGHAWLLAGGLLLLAHAPLPATGFAYDAVLHALFAGFALTMVFAHAPIIFPAIIQAAVPFRRVFYAHLSLLNGAVALRLLGDVLEWPVAVAWGGLLNGVAVAIFLLNTASSAAAALLRARRGGP